MKAFTYDCEHAMQWAEFSGDYNPVHFDLNAAAELNQSGLIAHGMRVQADINNHVFSQIEGLIHDSSTPVRLSTKFEQPVLCGTKYTLLDQTGSKKKTFRLADPSTGLVHIRMSVSQSNYSEARDCIARTKITREYQDSAVKYWPSGIGSDYVTFLSLIMFRELCRVPNLLPRDIFHEHLPVGPLPTLLLKKRVLQTHYELYCDHLLFKKNKEDLDGVFICTGKPSVTGEEGYGWLIQVQVAAKDNEKTLIQISVTLKVFIN